MLFNERLFGVLFWVFLVIIVGVSLYGASHP